VEVALGLFVPGKAGSTKRYTLADMEYDIAAGLIEVPANDLARIKAGRKGKQDCASDRSQQGSKRKRDFDRRSAKSTVRHMTGRQKEQKDRPLYQRQA
jgi:hypothetical protein